MNGLLMGYIIRADHKLLIGVCPLQKPGGYGSNWRIWEQRHGESCRQSSWSHDELLCLRCVKTVESQGSCRKCRHRCSTLLLLLLLPLLLLLLLMLLLLLLLPFKHRSNKSQKSIEISVTKHHLVVEDGIPSIHHSKLPSTIGDIGVV